MTKSTRYQHLSLATIVEGTFACIAGPNCTDKWVIDDGSITAHVYQRVTGAATVLKDGGAILNVYTSLEGAQNALNPEYQAALDLAKERSGAYWA